MKTIEVEIKGTTALMLCRFAETTEVDKSTRTVLVSRGTPREQAEKACYRDKDQHFYFPGTAIARMLIEAGGNHKVRGTRKSAKYLIPAAVLVMEEAILIRNGDGGLAKDFEVDSRPVVIPATKGRIMAHRPRFDCWSAKFTLRINETLLPVDFINQLLTEGSQQIGVGSFRPEKRGPYGTFLVESWKEIDGAKPASAKRGSAQHSLSQQSLAE
jgi:hypothetical protein